MDNNTKKNLIVGGLVTSGIIVIVILAMSYKPSETTTSGGTTSQTGSLLDSILNLFTTKNKTCVNNCSTVKKGYDCNGFADIKCGFGG